MRATSLTRVGTTRISAIARRRRSFCTVIGERTRWTALAVLFLSRFAYRSHSFAFGDMPDLDESLSWHLSSDSSALTLSVVLAGDFNGDQSVDLADYVVWRNMQGGRGAYLAADASGPLGGPDGVVDQWDYGVWKANFGASAADFAASRPSGVPEPAACTLLVIASMVCFAARA